MKSMQTLIELARAKVHTDRELAHLLGIAPPDLTELKKGRRPVSPEIAAALCDVLQLSGEEAREWLALAVIENPKNASKVELLRRALFACWVLGVGIPQLHPNDARATEAEGSQIGRTDPAGYDSVTHSLYIVAHALGRALVGALGLIRPACRRDSQVKRQARGPGLEDSGIAAAGLA